MRVISGKLGGRNFSSPHGQKTHPMSEKVRGGLFNALGDITGLTVLDVFGGSGALSFEAVSRGASVAIVLDNDRQAQTSITESIQALRVDNQVRLIKASVNAWLLTRDSQETFDLIFCDPPYDDLQLTLLQKLPECLKQNGIIVYSLPPQTTFQLNESYKLLRHKSYGDAELVFYRKIS